MDEMGVFLATAFMTFVIVLKSIMVILVYVQHTIYYNHGTVVCDNIS